MRKSLGPDEWRRLVLELEESRQTHKEFAAAKGVSMSTLQFWLYMTWYCMPRKERTCTQARRPSRLAGSSAATGRHRCERRNQTW